VLEAKAESEQLAARLKQFPHARAEGSGLTLLNLVVTEARPGLGGKFILDLMKRNRDQAFPWNRLKVGSPVLLSTMKEKVQQSWQAVVCGRFDHSIQIACNELPEVDDHLRIDLSSDEMTLKRQLGTLNAMKIATGRAAKLREVLLGTAPARFSERRLNSSPNQAIIDKANELGNDLLRPLNPSQQRALKLALSAEDIAIIHGPPGTGKTTTVVEVIRQAIARGDKVLAMAPSNTAVDNLLEKLIEHDVDAVRLGHPARVLPHLRTHSLDLMLENDDSMEVVRDMIREAEGLFQKADRFTRSRPPAGAKRDMRATARQLKSDARKVERQIIENILDRCHVICATLSGDLQLVGDRFFDLAIVDEACQSTEPGCWIPVLRSERLILAGDHCQLPPTVVSDDAARQGLGLSMMQRLVEAADKHAHPITAMLETQYRMHASIAGFSSQYFYDGRLVADDSVKSHRLCDLPNVNETEFTAQPVTFIDTAGSGFEEEIEEDGLSKLNLGEANLVMHQLGEILESGVGPEQIAVIAPYAAQVRLLRRLSQENSALPQLEKVEIDTVDGFQGREKEVVVISLVRSNALGEIGFLGDTRRMNVAITRARRKLIVIGDSATLAHHEFFKQLLDYFESIAAYHSVWEYGLI
jgi:hypothetical protein